MTNTQGNPRPQVKKNPDDPDSENINPEIIKLAQRSGHIRQPLELYLTGHLTWVQALETMVTILGKEFREQQNLLVQTLEDKPHLTLALSSDSYLAKAIPRHPLYVPTLEDTKPTNEPDQTGEQMHSSQN